MDKHAQGIDSKTAFSRLLNMYKWAHKYVFLVTILFIGLILRTYV